MTWIDIGDGSYAEVRPPRVVNLTAIQAEVDALDIRLAELNTQFSSVATKLNEATDPDIKDGLQIKHQELFDQIDPLQFERDMKQGIIDNINGNNI